jgi:hypothetical protein
LKYKIDSFVLAYSQIEANEMTMEVQADDEDQDDDDNLNDDDN